MSQNVIKKQWYKNPTNNLKLLFLNVCILPGRLGQLGMKQMLCKSVQNVAKAVNLFGKHGITEGTEPLLM